jgi:serine/threonine protein kinase
VQVYVNSWKHLITVYITKINRCNFNVLGIGEASTKSILLSVVAAVDFMHTEKLVHRNLKAENVLIFSTEDLTKVKITDFGLTRKEDCTVKNLDYTNVYHVILYNKLKALI